MKEGFGCHRGPHHFTSSRAFLATGQECGSPKGAMDGHAEPELQKFRFGLSAASDSTPHTESNSRGGPVTGAVPRRD